MATLLVHQVVAVDISPSRRGVPKHFADPPGKRFTLFDGDPERVQKANEINFSHFKSSLSLNQPSWAISDISNPEATTSKTVEITFKVRNISERNYTLSYPDAQRYDIALTRGNTGEGDALFVWSDDKIFVQSSGSSFMNPNDAITFTESVSLEKLLEKLTPGTYTIMAVLSNYPELKAQTTFQVTN